MEMSEAIWSLIVLSYLCRSPSSNDGQNLAVPRVRPGNLLPPLMPSLRAGQVGLADPDLNLSRVRVQLGLVLVKTVKPREVLNVPGLGTEAGPMPGTPNDPVGIGALGQRGPVVGALPAQGMELAALVLDDDTNLVFDLHLFDLALLEILSLAYNGFQIR